MRQQEWKIWATSTSTRKKSKDTKSIYDICSPTINNEKFAKLREKIHTNRRYIGVADYKHLLKMEIICKKCNRKALFFKGVWAIVFEAVCPSCGDIIPDNVLSYYYCLHEEKGNYADFFIDATALTDEHFQKALNLFYPERFASE